MLQQPTAFPMWDEGWAAPPGSIRKAASHLNVAASAIKPAESWRWKPSWGHRCFQAAAEKKLILTAGGGKC